jgi:hypothetical protein
MTKEALDTIWVTLTADLGSLIDKAKKAKEIDNLSYCGLESYYQTMATITALKADHVLSLMKNLPATN